MGSDRGKGPSKPSNSGKATPKTTGSGRFTEKRGYGPGGKTPRNQIPKPPSNKNGGGKK